MSKKQLQKSRIMTLVLRPAWLAGLGSREINAKSPEEQALTRRLGLQHVILPTHRGNDLYVAPKYGKFLGLPSKVSYREELHFLMRSLSYVYDSSVIGVDAPDLPTSEAELLRSVIVYFTRVK